MQTENLLSLGVYLMNGNKLIVGQEVVVELKFNKLQKAKVIDFKENLTEYTRMTMFRVCENTATLELESGELLKNFPFSMICIEEQKKVTQLEIQQELEYQQWMQEKGFELGEEMNYFGEDFYE